MGSNEVLLILLGLLVVLVISIPRHPTRPLSDETGLQLACA
jgi:hypothetical protein